MRISENKINILTVKISYKCIGLSVAAWFCAHNQADTIYLIYTDCITVIYRPAG